MTQVVTGEDDNEHEARRLQVNEADEVHILGTFLKFIDEKIDFTGSPEEIQDLRVELGQGLYDLFLRLREEFPIKV